MSRSIQAMISDHPYYEELAALAAGGYVSEEELTDLQRHAETCAECRNAGGEFRELVYFCLPLTEPRLHRIVSMTMSRPNAGATERFMQRASMEGITFSSGVRRLDSSRRWLLSFGAPAVGLAALLIAFIFGLHSSGHAPVQRSQENATQAQQQLEQLARQNSSLEGDVSRLQHALAEQQRETSDLRAQLASKMWQRTAPGTIKSWRYQRPRYQPPTTPSHWRRQKRNGRRWKNSWPIPKANWPG